MSFLEGKLLQDYHTVLLTTIVPGPEYEGKRTFFESNTQYLVGLYRIVILRPDSGLSGCKKGSGYPDVAGFQISGFFKTTFLSLNY